MFKVRLFGRDTLGKTMQHDIARFRDLPTGDRRCREGNHAQYLRFPRQPVEISHNWRLRSDASRCSGQRGQKAFHARPRRRSAGRNAEGVSVVTERDLQFLHSDIKSRSGQCHALAQRYWSKSQPFY